MKRTFAFVFFCNICLFLLLSSDEKLYGVWVNQDHNLTYTFEKDQIYILNKDEAITFPVRYGKGKLQVPDLGQGGGKWQLKYRLDGKLYIQNTIIPKNGSFGSSISLEFEKKSIKTKSIKITPLKLGTEKPNEQQIKIIANEFISRVDRDQRLRSQGKYDAQAQQKDYVYLKSILKKYGWTDSKKFGLKAVNAAFLITQHCIDMNVRKTIEIQLKKEIDQNPQVTGFYIWLYDRNLLYEKGYQRFGTHFTVDKGQMLFLPLESNGSKVDYWRSKYRIEKFKHKQFTLKHLKP